MLKKTLHFFVLLFLFSITAVAYSENIDSLLLRFEKSSGKEQKQEAIMLLKSVQQTVLTDSIFPVSKNTSKQILSATVYYALAEYFYAKNEFARSILYGKKACSLFEEKNDTASLLESYNILCCSEQRIGNIENALKYASLSLDMAHLAGNQQQLSSALHNSALLHAVNNENEIALQLELQAIAIEKTLHRSGKLAIRYGGLGEVYLNLRRHQEALDALSEALAIETKLGLRNKIGIRKSVIGDVYFDMGKHDSAAHYYREAFGIFTAENMKPSACICANQLGRLYIAQNNETEALSMLTFALETSREIHFLHMEQRSCGLLSRLYAKSNPALALKYEWQASQLKDSIFNEKNKEQIARFQVQYETYKKESQITLQEQELKQQRLLRHGLIIFLIISILVLILFIHLNHIRKNKNRALAEINATKDKFFSIISHDLKNPALSQKMSLEMLCKYHQSLSDEELNEQLRETLKSAESQVNLLLMLLDWSRVQTGRMTPEPSVFAFDSVLQPTLDVLHDTAKNKEITFSINTDPTVLYADRNMVSTILRNIISNAIKFSFRKGIIEIKSENHQTYTTILIIDHGQGISSEQMTELFSISNRGSRGTEGETGTGLGLTICKNMIELNHGTLAVVSDTEKHETVVSFTLPHPPNR